MFVLNDHGLNSAFSETYAYNFPQFYKEHENITFLFALCKGIRKISELCLQHSRF